MTGFGYAEAQDARLGVTVDIKSYNHRYLDISVNLPSHLGQLEPRVRELVTARAVRGRIEIYLRLTEYEEDLRVTVDRKAALAYKTSLDHLAREIGIKGDVRLSHLLKLEGVLKTERKRDLEIYWEAIQTPLSQAFQAWEAFRVKEGRSIRADVSGLLASIDEIVEFIHSRRDQVEARIKGDLIKRFEEMLGDRTDQDRVLAETALLLVKFDINEEIVRMRTHLQSFRDTIGSGLPMGKKLDFLAQELGREINTIGSKSINTEVSSHVIAAKDSLEKIREQLRNAE